MRLIVSLMSLVVTVAAAADDRSAAWSLHMREANAARSAGNYQRTEAELLAALELFHEDNEFPDDRLRTTLHNLALHYEDQGQHELAADYYRREVAAMRQAGLEERLLISPLSQLATQYERTGAYENALSTRLQVLRYSETTSSFRRAEALRQLAEHYAMRGLNESAEGYFERSLHVSRLDQSYVGLRTGVETMRVYAGFLSDHEPDRAQRLYRCAENIEEQIDALSEGDDCTDAPSGCSQAAQSVQLECDEGPS